MPSFDKDALLTKRPYKDTLGFYRSDYMANSMIDFLLNPVAVVVFIVVFAFSAVILVVKHKNLSIMQRVVFGIICTVCLAYFAFILWVIIGFGSSPPADPTPYLPTSNQ